MSKRVLLVLLGLVLLASSPALGQRDVIIGEHVQNRLETPHPYPFHAGGELGPVWTDTIHHEGAVYISIHFAEFELADGDYVIVRSEDGAQSWRYSGLGKRDLGRSKDGFYAAHIKGDKAIVELYSTSRAPQKALRAGSAAAERRYGYRIDHYGRGFNDGEIEKFWNDGLGEIMNLPYPPSRLKSLCGTDDTREAKCYQASDPAAYNTSNAVARLVKSGSAHCTGWLVGCEGHVMTNQHCIGSQSEANTIDFEFMAEGSNCSTSCASSLACPGTIEASGGTLVAVDSALDYALVLPDTSTASNTDLPATYGFMQLRDTGPVLGERIYIPQHPAGWGKRLAMESTHTADTTGFAEIVSLTETGCQLSSVAEVGYYADTQGGSSGSPVLGYVDNLVVALHHCRGSAACTGSGGDPNRGVAIDDIIADLGANLPACALGSGNNLPTVTITAPADGSLYDVGTNIAFAGTANDPEDGDLSASLAWSSSRDGAIGSGASFSTAGLSLGSHTITATVTDSGGFPASDTILLNIKDPNSNGPQTALYNAGLGAPSCAISGSSCDSGDLLDGRGSLGPEPNAPNTLDGCTDGASGSYHSDESNDRIVISSLDGSDLSEGATVEVAVTVWAWSTGTSDTLDLYYTADATNPSWTLIGSYSPPGGGAQTITVQHTLPAGSLQAIRANFRYNGTQSPCSGGSYDDADDLVFAVGGGAPQCSVDADCDNGLYCDGAETCNAGSCQAGSAPVCDDGVSCTVDSCNEATDSCESSASDALCDNGLFCDGTETCDSVLGCQAGTAPTCDDGVTCTVDSCDEAADACDFAPDDAFCSNGLFCDGSEVCDAGLGCLAGPGNPCAGNETCNEGTDTCDGTCGNVGDACIVDADCCGNKCRGKSGAMTCK